MTQRKSEAARARAARHRITQAGLAVGPTITRPSPAMFLSKHVYVADCQYIEQDESVILQATQRLTFARRVDCTPRVESWAMEELLFHLDHIEELSKGQQAAIHRVNEWIRLGISNG